MQFLEVMFGVANPIFSNAYFENLRGDRKKSEKIEEKNLNSCYIVTSKHLLLY